METDPVPQARVLALNRMNLKAMEVATQGATIVEDDIIPMSVRIEIPMEATVEEDLQEDRHQVDHQMDLQDRYAGTVEATITQTRVQRWHVIQLRTVQ